MTIDTPLDVLLALDTLDADECREYLARAITILRRHPKGQSDGTWWRDRQSLLERFFPAAEFE